MAANLRSEPMPRSKSTMDLIKDAPEYEEGMSYQAWQIIAMSHAILYEAARKEDPMLRNGIFGDGILSEEQVSYRKRREIYTTKGTPDPSIVSGIYWRTHPQGRKFVSSLAERKKGSGSYYV